jgi:hypothetical protein
MLNRLSYGPPASPPEDEDKNLRQRCRNPHCRSKLPAPVANQRNAFCCRGCHAAFYHSRCLICEEVMARKSGNQKVCGRRECRSTLKARTVESHSDFNSPDISKARGVTAPLLGIDAAVRHSGSNSPDISKLESAVGSDRARVVAGPKLSPSQLHCATVPDGPGGGCKGGEHRRIEAKNSAALEAAEQARVEADGGYFSTPDWQEVISPNGVRCWFARWGVS